MNPTGHHMMNGFHNNGGASTSSNSFHDLLPQHTSHPFFNTDHQQHPHPSQSMHNRHPHNDWQDHAMQMNTPHINSSSMSGPPPNPVHSQLQPPFNQGPWGSQMNPQQSFFNMPPGPMNAAFNMSFLPQQIIQEAYSMSIPVEGSDEPILLTKLLQAARQKESYKDALNSLHGRNGHSASLWKDYYLDNKDRLDAWIAMCLQKERETGRSSGAGSQRSVPPDIDRVKSSLPTIKKPSPASFKRESSPHSLPSRVSISAPAVKRPQKKSTPQSAHSTPPLPKDASQGSRRSTINSLTAPSPVYGERLPAPNAEIKIPDPPSRSPSPPTNIIPHRGRGNKYTKEDRDFFIRFIGWRLKQDPSLTRLDLCNLLAEKAPHHTAQSWASHWSNNHDVPDKILAAARGEEYDSSSESSSTKQEASSRPRPKYKDPTTTEESDGSESDDEKDGRDESVDEEDDKPIRIYSEKEMGQKGDPFTDADLYITAKHIAAFPSWHTATQKGRWESYSQKFPQRSAKAWAEYYRRNEQSLLKLAKRMQKAESKTSLASTSSIKTQCARPTRTPPKMKRKLDHDSSEESAVKRGRAA
ncbi:hypothetical protein CPB84DRAFT_1841435 [Gymnopilus junonius]|uniref:Uncharacterized protein n=1 Tax=Gymnopilus junonius TaxID=109634 RepID=A0A9P5P0H4_GYMJU|nr:hypothetical protein CPB84DRAFT_1841435 [Gymnopilus junonius]